MLNKVLWLFFCAVIHDKSDTKVICKNCHKHWCSVVKHNVILSLSTLPCQHHHESNSPDSICHTCTVDMVKTDSTQLPKKSAEDLNVHRNETPLLHTLFLEPIETPTCGTKLSLSKCKKSLPTSLQRNKKAKNVYKMCLVNRFF